MAKDPIKALEELEKKIDRRVEKVLNTIAYQVKRRVDSQEFIKWKTKRKPIVVEKARLVGHMVQAEVRTASRWKWGHVLVGPAGSTTIKAKSGMLAIPTDASHKEFRTRVLGPRHYGGLIAFNGILWGKAGWGGTSLNRYLRQHRAAGEIFKKQDLVPLFTLRKSVVVRRRVIPAEINRWGYQKLIAALKRANLLKP
jgi:hypothetical protein